MLKTTTAGFKLPSERQRRLPNFDSRRGRLQQIFWRTTAQDLRCERQGRLGFSQPYPFIYLNGTPQGAENCMTELIKKQKIRCFLDIMHLDVLLLRLIEKSIGMLNIESDQNQLIKQLVELIKMNVDLLIHERGILQSKSKLELENIDVLLATSNTTDQASTSTQHDDPVKKAKEIYNLLKCAKANARQLRFDQNLIEDIRHLIQQYHGEFQGEHQHAPTGSNIDPNNPNNDLLEHIINLLPVELRPALVKPNLHQVKGNLEQMNQILIHLEQRPCESYSNQIELKDKLINVTSNLIRQISIVDCRLSNLKVDSNWEQIMKSNAARIDKLMYTPKADLYIDRMDSFKDFYNQVAAMYKHSLKIEQSERRIDDTYTWCRSFHKDIFNGNCERVEKFLKEHPLALTARITVDGNTALHVAVKANKLKIVKKLLGKLTEEQKHVETLKKQNKEGKTALYIAASSGFIDIAKELVNTDKATLLIEYNDGNDHILPLFVAAKYDNKDMVEYIYKEMHECKVTKESSGEHKKVKCFSRVNQNDPKAMRQWALLLANLIYKDDYDMASHIFKDYPFLALSKNVTDVETPLFALAQRPSLGANVTFHGEASKFQCPTFICGNKMDGGIALKASKLLKSFIFTIDDLESQKPALSAALFKAVEVGSVEFVAMFINSLPLVLSWLNDLHQNIFHVAIINRQENILNLIYGLGSVKNDLTGSADKLNNWMLHLAGDIAPANRLNQVPGPAMQVQRELQWFQAVEEIVPNISIDVKNLDNKTAHELFAEKHKLLMKDGEDWMRNTASSCSIVATLISTVMFAAAFTVPGGNNQDTGNPIFLGGISFLIFAVSDLVALSTSCTSVLIFLSILTSRFAQKDFLKSLPMRLIWGLALLFVSMAAMMFAFCDAIYIIIQNQYHWFCIPVIVLVGCIPVFIFLCMMFPLLIKVWQATNISIFKKSTRDLYH